MYKTIKPTWPKNTLFTLKNISAYKHLHPEKI